MFNIYKTRLKILFNQKMLLFWILFFPILLSLFFNMSLRKAYGSDPLDTINIAVVDESNTGSGYSDFKDVFEGLSLNDDEAMFNIDYLSKEDANSQLNENTIDGYILYSDVISLVVNDTGVNQSVIKSVLDTYSRVNKTIMNIMVTGGKSIEDIDVETIYENGEYVVDSGAMTKKADLYLNHFYALIAMACLLASSYGIREITDIQANLSPSGARLGVSSTPKSKFIIGSLCAAFTIQVIADILLIAFLKYFLKIDFGSRMPLVLLTCLLGSLFGLFLGSFISVLSKKDVDFKESMATAVVLISCFLSGLMIVQMKQLVAESAPILSYINPANLITDGLYSLYYYDSLSRYFINMGILAAYTIIFGVTTCLIARRSRYASI